MAIMNEGHWLGRNGQRRSIVGDLELWWEWKKSKPLDLGWVDQTIIRRRRCLKDNAREWFYSTGNGFYQAFIGW